MASGPDSADELIMRFDLNVLQHLGLKMYTSLPAVISEYVANSWDALARNVEIAIPDESMNPNYEIRIEDDGIGMTKQEVNERFLVVGRNRREDEKSDTVSDEDIKRDVMGRKGIGKLAGFGVADIVRVRSRKNGEVIEFELNYGEMRQEAKEDPNATTTYRPKILEDGFTNEPSGTTVKLAELDRGSRPDTTYVRQRIARRFSVIGDQFNVTVNGNPVTGEERNLIKRCQFLRTYTGFPVDEEGNYTIDGWIGTLKNPVPDNIQGGVAVMARGKTAQKPITFGVGEGGAHGQQALQYLVGEIKANFLDDDDDLIATHRTEVLWERSPADLLYNLIAEEIRDFISEWPERRAVEEVEEIKEEEPYQKYIAPLDEREQKLADDFLGNLAKRGNYNDEVLEDMASYVSTGVQQKAFSDLLREIEESDVGDTERLLELFDHYEVLDAMNSLRIVKGRMRAIQKFEELVETGERSIRNLHGFVSDNPWLIDPRWDYLDEEFEISDEINRNFVTDDPSRIGFICLGDEDTIRVIDIREPGHILSVDDLIEFEKYVDYLRSLSGMDPVGERDIEGYIVAKGHKENRDVHAELRRMRMDDMRVRSYENIQNIARRTHKSFIDVFERKAVRTGSEMLQSHLTSDRQIGIDSFTR